MAYEYKSLSNNWTGSYQLIFLLAFTVIYSAFISILTFSKDKLSFLSETYLKAKDQDSKYKTTLYASSGYSYLLVILILGMMMIAINRNHKSITNNYGLITGILIFSMLGLLALSVLLAYLPIHDNLFGKKIKSWEFNYPFLVTSVYTIIFIIFASWYLTDIKQDYDFYS